MRLTRQVTATIRTLGISSVLLSILLITSSAAAHADGRFRWQNVYNGRYLEVYFSSLESKARVITYPENPASLNQLWLDTQLTDDGYFAIRNANSLKSLGRADEYIDSRRCGTIDQYDWVGASSQYWKFAWVWSDAYQTYFNFWINQEGCHGNPYWDRLGADLLNDSGVYPIETWLWKGAECDDRRYGEATMCFWNRA